jgi:hypothetical protein
MFHTMSCGRWATAFMMMNLQAAAIAANLDSTTRVEAIMSSSNGIAMKDMSH